MIIYTCIVAHNDIWNQILLSDKKFVAFVKKKKKTLITWYRELKFLIATFAWLLFAFYCFPLFIMLPIYNAQRKADDRKILISKEFLKRIGITSKYWTWCVWNPGLVSHGTCVLEQDTFIIIASGDPVVQLGTSESWGVLRLTGILSRGNRNIFSCPHPTHCFQTNTANVFCFTVCLTLFAVVCVDANK